MLNPIIDTYENDQIQILTIGKPLDAGGLFTLTDTEARATLKKERCEHRNELLSLIAGKAQESEVLSVGVLRVPRFNASITTLPLLSRTEIERISNVEIIRGTDETFFHDGIALKKGEGVLIITADCHVVSLWTEPASEYIVAAHAGRNSLHTINHVHTNNTPSVIDVAIQSLSTKNPNTIHARTTAGINKAYFSHPLEHPVHGEHNKKLVEYFSQFGGADANDLNGHIDVAESIRGQLVQAGVPQENIEKDTLDTYTDDRLWSNRLDGKSRNAILVLHKK